MPAEKRNYGGYHGAPYSYGAQNYNSRPVYVNKPIYVPKPYVYEQPIYIEKPYAIYKPHPQVLQLIVKFLFFQVFNATLFLFLADPNTSGGHCACALLRNNKVLIWRKV